MRRNPCRVPTSAPAAIWAGRAASRSACSLRCPWARTGCGLPTTTDGRRTPRSSARCWTVRHDIRWPRSHRWCATWPIPPGWRFPCAVAWPGDGGSPSCASTGPATCWQASRRCSTAPCSAHRRWKPSGCRTFGCSSAATKYDVHRRLVRSGLPFGTCLDAVYLHPQGSDEFKPILGGRMHTQYPADDTKRYFTYRNRGYILSQRGMRRLIPQEWLRFGWFFLVTRRDPAGMREWLRLRRLGRDEKFWREKRRESMTFTDAAAQSKTFASGVGRSGLGLRQARAVAASRLAGHQAALPPLGARAHLDHHRDRHHGRRAGRAVLHAVPPAAGRTPALRHARADHLEPDQRLHPRGRGRVRRRTRV